MRIGVRQIRQVNDLGMKFIISTVFAKLFTATRFVDNRKISRFLIVQEGSRGI